MNSDIDLLDKPFHFAICMHGTSVLIFIDAETRICIFLKYRASLQGIIDLNKINLFVEAHFIQASKDL